MKKPSIKDVHLVMLKSRQLPMLDRKDRTKDLAGEFKCVSKNMPVMLKG
jgi:hypothetical protein